MIKNVGVALSGLFLASLGGSVSAQPPPERTPSEVRQPPSEVRQPPAEEGPRPAASAGLDLSTLHVAGGLTAADAAARALDTAPSLERSRQAAAAAQAGADRAWLGVLPRLDLSARYTRLSDVDQPSFGGDFDPAALEPVIAAVEDPAAQSLFRGIFEGLGSGFEFPVILDQWGLRASLAWPVSDVFLSILPAYRASASFADAERLRAQSQGETVALRAREAFYSYVRARGALLVADTAVAQVQAHRDNVRALVEGGVAAPVDLMRVDAQLASTQVGVERARGGVAISAHALRSLMHLEGDDEIPVGENLLAVPPPVDAPRAELVARARDNRAEMRALRLVATGQEHAVTARAAQRYPRLGLQANYDYANPNNRIIPQRQEWNGTWDVSVVLSWSPNDLLLGNAAVDQARAELAQTQADMASLSDAVEIEVVQAHQGYETARAALEAAQLGITAAEESYRVRTEQIRAGTAVTSDLIDAESELTRARLQLLDALIDAHVARARLDRALGE